MVIISLSVMTLGIVGILRMPDIYTKLHGASKSVFLGVVLLSISASAVATAEMIDRIILIALLVVMTTPISSHVIGHAAYRMQERMETPGAVDESHTLVPDAEHPEEPTWRL
jgi:multicomponent Na+:H+ antiporter subunit G